MKDYIWVVYAVDTDPDKTFSERAVSFWKTKEEAIDDAKKYTLGDKPDEYNNGTSYDFGSMVVERHEIGVPW